MIVKHAKGITRQVHRARAALVVEKERSCEWLVDKADIMEALGKIPSDYALLAMAKHLCEMKPNAAEAIELIRKHRRFDQLTDEIVRVVNGYCRKKPSTTSNQIEQAMEAASATLARISEPEDPSQVDELGEPGQHQFLRQPVSPVSECRVQTMGFLTGA